MKLLIVDDNKAVRTTLKLVLAKEFDQIVAVGDPRCFNRTMWTLFCLT